MENNTDLHALKKKMQYTKVIEVLQMLMNK